MTDISNSKFSNSTSHQEENNGEPVVSISGRVAIYDNMRSIPRIVDLKFNSIKDFLDKTPQITYSLSHEQGGLIPFTIIKEVIENLIHADFKEVTITILENGNHIIVSDQGPGIADKEKAFLPGYSSATQSMKKYIRGVGSGLPIVKETITFSGGNINITDNLKNGTVISLKINKPLSRTDTFTNKISVTNDKISNDRLNNTGNINADFKTLKSTSIDTKPKENEKENGYEEKIAEKYINDQYDFKKISLSLRQIKILSLILELDEIGPSKIVNELGFSLSTSYRELIFLENLGFLTTAESGKRKITLKGKKYLEYYSNNF